MPPVHPDVRIGHVHLKVADLERALRFYRDVLGFELTQRYGPGAAFLSAGGYHHHIGLNTWESLGGSPPPPGTTGLYHTAILYPTRAELAVALRRVLEARIPLDGAADHGVSEALYLRDPDDNGVELYWDRPRDEWPRTADGRLAMFTRRLDLEALLREGDPAVRVGPRPARPLSRNEIRVRVVRRPPQCRQVHAAEPHRRAQAGDRVRQAADHPHADRRREELPGRPGRVRRHARRPQAHAPHERPDGGHRARRDARRRSGRRSSSTCRSSRARATATCSGCSRT